MWLRRFFLLISVLLLATAWWATRGSEAPARQEDTLCRKPAPYPADFEERLGRVPGFALRVGTGAAGEQAWECGADEPDIGDENAKKGGRVRLANAGPYPAHFLAFGSVAPQFFHYNLYTAVEIPLVARHPQTGRDIPGTAEAWAVDGNTILFRLNPAARYSNGRPLRAADYVLGALLRAESGDASFEQLRDAAVALEACGDSLLRLTLRQAPRSAAEAAALLHAAEPAFYAEFGSDYRTRYADRAAPTTGAYTLGSTERGRMAELRRVPDWWARDLRYYRHRFNADAVEHHFLTDEAQAWEFLLRGRLDLLQTRKVSVWQQRRPELEAQGLVAAAFTAEYPLPPYGIALNAERLNDTALRRGLMHAVDMAQAIALLTCGEGERLTTFHSGYGALTPRDTPTAGYDISAARAAFAEAGYDHRGEDGILRRADGTPLRLRFTYTPSDKTSTLAAVLAASARRCGADIVPEPVPWQTAAKMQEEGDYDLLFWVTVAPPAPEPARFLSSRAAGYDAPFRLRDARMDALLEVYAAAPPAECAAALAAVDSRLAELAVWIPAWKENRLYLGHPPRLRFPHGYTPHLHEAAEEHLFWIEP